MDNKRLLENKSSYLRISGLDFVLLHFKIISVCHYKYPILDCTFKSS